MWKSLMRHRKCPHDKLLHMTRRPCTMECTSYVPAATGSFLDPLFFSRFSDCNVEIGSQAIIKETGGYICLSITAVMNVKRSPLHKIYWPGKIGRIVFHLAVSRLFVCLFVRPLSKSFRIRFYRRFACGLTGLRK